MTQAVTYLSGFGNEFATEAMQGTLPDGRNSPQKPAHGLYAEQLSGTAFTMPRAQNKRTWLYRACPTVSHKPFKRRSDGWLNGNFAEIDTPPNRFRWDPLPLPSKPTDFVDGLTTVAGNAGVGIHVYLANQSMKDRAFFNADGEMLFVLQQGRLRFVTEMGIIEAAPGEIVVIPRGVYFRVELHESVARGYILENYGALFRIPDLGPIGSNGLANPRDFLTPVAAYESSRPTEIVQKYQHHLWTTDLDRSPFNVVAWHGNLAPYKYDLSKFNTIGTVSFDHPDPSIFTVLTSPSDTPGTANADFVIFPPRWMVAEDTFRPPWFHRNVMSEFMGLIHGVYDAKEGGGFVPGGMSVHNCMAGHGPDVDSYQKAITAELKPHKIENTLAFMFETRLPICLTRFALETPSLQSGYDACWQGFPVKIRGN